MGMPPQRRSRFLTGRAGPFIIGVVGYGGKTAWVFRGWKMEANLTMLVGLFFVLAIFALALIVLLIRSLRKSRGTTAKPVKQMATPMQPESDDVEKAGPWEAADPDVVVPDGTQSQDESRELAPEPNLAAKALQFEGPEISTEPEDVLLMRVWQDREGVLVVEAEGRKYRRLYDISDGTVGRQVLATVKHLVAFSKGQIVHTSPSAQIAESSMVSGELDDRLLMDVADMQEEVTSWRKSRISADPIPFRTQRESEQRYITLNLAEEIEQLLQQRLSELPQFGRRYIHVSGAPDGTLCFHVDGARYNSVDEIIDPDVQTLVRAVISDWNAKR
jgi:hypothetical protein